jgi:hypothetical protein
MMAQVVRTATQARYRVGGRRAGHRQRSKGLCACIFHKLHFVERFLLTLEFLAF